MLDVTRYYKSILRSYSSSANLESTGEITVNVDDLYSKQRKECAENELKRIVGEYLDDDPKLQAIADEIIKESIVRTDGFRPCSMIRNGKKDFKSSPTGIWQSQLHPWR